MENKVFEISDLIGKVRDKIELAMLEILCENNNDPIKFDSPIKVVNDEDYDSPGLVYGVEVDFNPDSGALVAISTSWGDYSKDDAELYHISDFTTDDLEWILIRMYKTFEK